MSKSIYDELPAGDFVSWDEIGQKIVGDVVRAEIGRDFNGNPCPQLSIRSDDGHEITLTCGQANLRAQVIEHKVLAGDRVSIEFASTEKREKGVMKKFTVKVVKGGAKGTVAAPEIDESEPF